MLGKTPHLQTLLFFYENREFIGNLTGLSERLGWSHVTVRRVVRDLLSLGVLEVLNIGRSKVVRLNKNSPYTQALFEFIDKVRTFDFGSGVMSDGLSSNLYGIEG